MSPRKHSPPFFVIVHTGATPGSGLLDGIRRTSPGAPDDLFERASEVDDDAFDPDEDDEDLCGGLDQMWPATRALDR